MNARIRLARAYRHGFSRGWLNLSMDPPRSLRLTDTEATVYRDGWESGRRERLEIPVAFQVRRVATFAPAAKAPSPSGSTRPDRTSHTAT
ncbi:hypothetical protein [Thioalkalivibrio paradoxus]|uniref:Uncharacterized protein n=1 Tax=Thioalkalivibrio paradoxus ARh 1 TaxID=713585 RepID=W0DJN7_9GAMM|nr:hypothetical protein [Thioalkalivibrio paradoxus]AHE97188.1 hypothetical protein THITH_01640 [Thioalkalivibrio paradoxus ARh 1]